MLFFVLFSTPRAQNGCFNMSFLRLPPFPRALGSADFSLFLGFSAPDYLITLILFSEEADPYVL
jgi:hypothetical protein